jgi:large subunit ribosomal protein L30e
MIDDISKNLQGKKLIIGTDRSIKNLKNGKLKKVFVASNTKSDILADIEHYSKTLGTEFVKLDVKNDELGTLCKKPFSISVIGLLR